MKTTNNTGNAPSGGRPPKDPPTLRQRALRALARRDYSRAELARKLRGGDDAEAEVEALLDQFQASGWLSDERYAEGAARQKQGRYSQRHIVAGLKASGVAADTAQEAVAALEQDDLGTARALWQQRFGKPPADQKEKARQVRFLQARGFALGVVFRVLREAGSAVDEE